MKQLTFLPIVFSLLIFITSCGGPEYAGYKTTYYDNYEPIGVYTREQAVGNPATVITCSGPGDECEINGPLDGYVAYWREQTSTICQTVYVSSSKKSMYINEIAAAFEENRLDGLLDNQEYDFLFVKSSDRKKLFEKLNSREYGICYLNDNGFIVYSGDLSKDPKNIYQTIFVDKDDKE